ncbi:MAG: diphthine--ammonia ligase [Dehalogenimonas sp.]
MDVFVSWSGGKDCSLSLYRALKADHRVHCLASIFTKEVGRLYPHHLTPEVIKSQAEAIDIPMIINWTTGKDYTNNYIEMLKGFRQEGITGAVFGDVSLGNPDALEHRMWIERVCQASGIEPILPLWDEDRESIISDLIDSGFISLIIAADDSKLGRSWLGRNLDHELLSELKSLHASSADGKIGLYHTLTLDGPIFKKRLEIAKQKVVFKECGLYDGKPTVAPFWYLELDEPYLVEKPILVSNLADQAR